MTALIDKYPALRDAYLVLQSCNGGLWGARTPENACLEVDEVIVRADPELLNHIDQWLQTLTEDELIDFVDGDEDEKIAWLKTQSYPADQADKLFDDLFEIPDYD
jgi:hypothetical protein